MTARSTVIIAGGGTGGHIFPGLAIADALRAAMPELEVHWIGGRHGQEGRLVAAHGLPLHFVAAARIVGSPVIARLRGAFALLAGIVQAFRVMRRLRPAVVIGVGGYASAAAGLAARLLRIPLIVQEQNARPGRTNRLLGRFARQVAVAFDDAAPYFAKDRVVDTGNPVRAAVAAVPPLDIAGRTQRRLLVMGGSQGARFLNENVPALLQQVVTAGRTLEVVHQSGPRELEATRTRYTELGLAAEVTAFIDDIPAAYERADFVICRAGATTVAELKAAGRPALLVPFPHAADDHQAANAEALVKAGAALMVRQENWERDSVAALLEGALGTDEVQRMAAKARALARPEAAPAVAHIALQAGRLMPQPAAGGGCA